MIVVLRQARMQPTWLHHHARGEHIGNPDIRRLNFFETRAPDLPTTSLGLVFHPEWFFDGPDAQRGPREAKNYVTPLFVFFRDAQCLGILTASPPRVMHFHPS